MREGEHPALPARPSSFQSLPLLHKERCPRGFRGCPKLTREQRVDLGEKIVRRPKEQGSRVAQVRVQVVHVPVHRGEVWDGVLCRVVYALGQTSRRSFIDTGHSPIHHHEGRHSQADHIFSHQASQEFFRMEMPTSDMRSNVIGNSPRKSRGEKVGAKLLVSNHQDLLLPSDIAGHEHRVLQVVDVPVHSFGTPRCVCTTKVALLLLRIRVHICCGNLFKLVGVLEILLTIALSKAFDGLADTFALQLKGFALLARWSKRSQEPLDDNVGESRMMPCKSPRLPDDHDSGLDCSTSGCHPDFIQVLKKLELFFVEVLQELQTAHGVFFALLCQHSLLIFVEPQGGIV
mmetsp:Transcript_44375/g.105092  ORF Transcript_44375/g.105092 Transcript_44375/m.105092 type:complete len:346 (+) Transcript_44375:309-1346(+)